MTFHDVDRKVNYKMTNSIAISGYALTVIIILTYNKIIFVKLYISNYIYKSFRLRFYSSSQGCGNGY